MTKISLHTIVLLFSFACLFSKSYAQTTFRTSYDIWTSGDIGFGIREVSDGYIIAGTTQMDGLLMKVDFGGNSLWTSTYRHVDGSASSSEYSYCVEPSADGGYIIGGKRFNDPLDGGYIYKTDSNGAPVWSISDSSTNLITKVISLEEHSSGKIFFLDFSEVVDIRLGCLDATGNLIWSKKYYGSADEDADDLFITSDGNIIVIGYTQSYGTGGLMDAYLFKIDTAGTILWTKTYGGVNHDFGHCVVQTQDDGLILMGHTESFTQGGWDVFLIRTDSNGDTLWCKSYGTASENEEGHQIVVTNDGGFAFTVSDANGVYLVKTDSSGNFLWGKHYPGFAFQGWKNNGLEYTSDGGFILCGTEAGKVHLIKTDANGNSKCGDNNYNLLTSNAPFSVSVGGVDGNGFNFIQRQPLVEFVTSVDSLFCSSVGMDQLFSNGENMLIFPNPASDQITIQSSDFNIDNISIYSVIGQCIFNLPLTNKKRSVGLDVSFLPNGVYFVHLLNEQSVLTSEKLIIQR